jgi:phage repressor protein C with HTH and peptisase S24 domain
MSNPSCIDPSRLVSLIERAGLTHAELARRVGVKQPTITRLTTGEQAGSKHLHKIAQELATTPGYLLRETDDPSEGYIAPPTAQVVADELGLVSIRQLDLAFGMGATFLDIPVAEKFWRFPRDWLRQYTNAPSDKLMFAQGAGDSMFPTLLDSDTMLIDCSNQVMTMADQIWAISYCGMGMIKRLRPSKDGGMRIMSDNPNVREETAYDNEMQLIGRVVGIFRKM